MEAPRVPGWFEQQLALEFDRQIRVRWSRRRNRFQIERRGSRGKLPRAPLSSLDDRAIRWQDGYYVIAEITPGDRTPCSRCGREMRPSVREFRVVHCPHCKQAQRAFFFPLGDDLLQHLRWSDPDRGGLARTFEDQLTALDRREQQGSRRLRNDIAAMTLEDQRALFDVAMVGYTKEPPWSPSPSSIPPPAPTPPPSPQP